MPRRVQWKGEWPVRAGVDGRPLEEKGTGQAGEIVVDVRNYDAVLRWHCRLDETVTSRDGTKNK
jgi:hypothetical protein